MRFSPFLVLALLTACQANASVSAKANTGGEASGEASGDMSTSSNSSQTAPAPTPVTSTPPQQVAATGSSCPFECFIADGASSTPIAADEEQRLHGAFATTISGMQQCVGGSGWSRRRSSPVLNVRVNFKGEVTDVGVDARGYELYDSCIAGVSRPLPDGNFSGPSTIRCSERCAPAARRTRSKNGPKGRPAPDPAAPAASTAPAATPAQ